MVQGIATDCSLSLTIAQVEIPAEACEEVADDLGNRRWFSPCVYWSRISQDMAENVPMN